MFITADAARIYATAFGSPAAPVIMGVGGWTGSCELWAEPFALLSARWRTIAYDHRGAGVTVAPLETITHEQLIDDVFTVLDAYAVERCVLAAESSGALSALAAARARPERIVGLVIVDGLYERDPNIMQSPFAQGLRSNYLGTLQGFVDMCVPEPDSEHIKRWGMKILSRSSQAEALALLQVGIGAGLRAELPQIGQPALVIHGERDAIVAPAEARALAEALPNARLELIAGAGHVPTITRPAEVAALIEQFCTLLTWDNHHGDRHAPGRDRGEATAS